MADQVIHYHNEDLGFATKITKQNVSTGKDLNSKDIKNLCSGFLTNAIYANIVEGNQNFEQGRKEAFAVAAQVVIKHGVEIKEQLEKNAVAALQTKNEAPQNNNNTQPSENQNQPNTSEDTAKISGGTISHIIQKISEMMNAASPEQKNDAAKNVGALFEVLKNSFDKIPQAMQKLAENPIAIANIKDLLQGTEGGNIFGKWVETHLNPDQKTEVSKVSKEDLETYRAKTAVQQKNQTGLSL